MNEQLFQSIFDKIQDFLPDNWKKTVFLASYNKESYSMKFYVSFDNNSYINCFDLPTTSSTMLMKLFLSIDKDITAVRNRLPITEMWNVVTISVDSSGNFKSNLDYSNDNENFIDYEQKWRYRYLV